MIKEAKDLLEAVVTTYAPADLPVQAVVRNAADEKTAILGRKHPFVALITAPGSFKDATARTVREKSGEDLMIRFVRGERTVPIYIRIWTKNEEEADRIVSAIIPRIPRRWEYDGVAGRVRIMKDEASDFASKVAGQYVAAVVVEFSVEVATPPEAAPRISKSEVEPDELG